jgi:hypothetical protein
VAQKARFDCLRLNSASKPEGYSLAVMPKSKGEIPEFPGTSPISILCPTCMSMPGLDCITGGFAAIHVARVEAAALADKQRNSAPRK